MNLSVLPPSGSVFCDHNPPVSAADLRLDTYKNNHGPAMYGFLGGARKNYLGCIVSFDDHGKLFARELGGYLTHQGQKDIVYAKFSPGKEPPLGPLNGDTFRPENLRNRKLIITSDCLLPGEREQIEMRLQGMKDELGFEDVAYALEKD